MALGGFTEASLHALLTGPAAAELGGWYGAYARQSSDTQAWLATIETTGRVLWDRLMGPVHERLRTLGLVEGAPVLMLPQGGLGLLPLHAAWHELEGGMRRYFLDDYTVIYAASGYALAVSLRRLDEIRRHHRGLLAVMDPTKELPFAPAEIGAIAARFTESKPRVLRPGEATAAAVFGTALRSNYLHFACHGSYDWRDPMRSGLMLAGEAHELPDVGEPPLPAGHPQDHQVVAGPLEHAVDQLLDARAGGHLPLDGEPVGEPAQ